MTEQYTFDPQTGLLTNQKAIRNSTELLNLSYEYNRGGSVGSLSGKTGHLTKIIDNLNTNKNREYEFDALGRLTKAKGGTTGTLWNQTYTYDRFGNRTNVTASGTAADSSPIPLDGTPNLTYHNDTNRITTSGYDYDVAGNQIRGFAQDGTPLTYEYDAGNRIAVIKRTSDGSAVQAFQYGSTNARLIDWDAAGTGLNTFYCSVGGTVMAEYIEYSQNNPTWTKSYTYLGDTQLATITPSGGSEVVEFSHPDRLGARLKTNQSAGTSVEQVHLPFGTALNAESTLTNNNKRFTSYDRSPSTGLDYAMNRTYDNKLGRFTQIDPIGMSAIDLNNPQTLNLFNYCGNDPINHTDPDGLFWGFFKKLFKAIGKALKWIAVAVAVIAAVISVVGLVAAITTIGIKVTATLVLGVIASVATAASEVFGAFGLKTAANIFGIIGAAASFGASFFNEAGRFLKTAKDWTTKAIMNAVKAGATLVSKTLSAYGHAAAARVFDFAASVAGFIGGGYTDPKNPKHNPARPWRQSKWSWFKFLRGSAEQIAKIAGNEKLAGYIGLGGLVEDGFDLSKLFGKLPPDPFAQRIGSVTIIPAPKLLEIGWIASQVISRVYKGAGIANRSFKRIDRVVVAR